MRKSEIFVTTKIQDMVLDCYKDFYNETGTWPTLGQVTKILGYAGISSVQRHLKALKKKGLINNENRKWFCDNSYPVKGKEDISPSSPKE